MPKALCLQAATGGDACRQREAPGMPHSQLPRGRATDTCAGGSLQPGATKQAGHGDSVLTGR